jgi:hypothetical protein
MTFPLGLLLMACIAWTTLVQFVCSNVPFSPNQLIPDKKFYIYEGTGWNELATASLFPRDPNERLENQLHQGAGPILNETRGEYHTDQYQLFSMIYYRALKDPRRTLDPEEATSFLIPYDFATDAAYYKNCARSSGVCYDFRKCPLAPDVEALLQESTYFQRKGGKDHVLIVGMNYAMDHYILKPKCKSLLAGTCTNCTKFAIDDYSYMYSDNKGILARGDHWHAIPFPADFHWSRQFQDTAFPWENRDRPLVAAYIGSDKSFYGPSRRLRASILHYCGLHTDTCAQQSYGLNGTRFSFKVDNHNPLAISRHAVFCFQPTGDLMTRKGLFDSILQGCIPVLYDPLTAAVMYTWHWEESFWKENSVSFPFHSTAFRYFDPVEALIQMVRENATWIAETQKRIREKVFELQYGLDGLVDRYQYQSSLPYLTMRRRADNVHAEDFDRIVTKGTSKERDIIYSIRNATLSNGGSSSSSNSNSNSNSNSGTSREEVISSVDGGRWPRDATGRFQRDAYDIVMDYVLGWHSGRWADVRNATVPECWDGWLDSTLNKCRPDNEKPK